MNKSSRLIPTRKGLLAVLAVAIACAVFPVAANATFSVSAFSLAPSSLQAAGHPTLTFKFTRNRTFKEDVRDISVDYPSGQLFNPEAATTKCTATRFNADQCPSASFVGTVSASVVKEGGFNSTYTVRGSVYVLEPGATEHAALGYVMRPSFSPKVFLKQVINIRTDSDSSQRTTTTNIPRTYSWWFPQIFGTYNIAIKSVTVTYNAKANSTKSGPYFVWNPSECTAKTAKLTATSYQNVVSTQNYVWTPTGCASVPLTPVMTTLADDNVAGHFTGGMITAEFPFTDSTIQQSTVKSVEGLFPVGTQLNFAALGAINGGIGCSEAQLASDSCPAATQIGDAAAEVPFYPNSGTVTAHTGKIFIMDPIDSTIYFAVVLNGPRGMKTIVRSYSGVTGSGPTSRVYNNWDYVPNFPWKKFSMHITTPLLKNPSACPQTAVGSAKFTGYSGAVTTLSPSYDIVCPAVSTPETTIDSAPSGIVNNASQTITFSSSSAAATFECSVDGSATGPWSACTSPLTQTYTDGPHNVWVRSTDTNGPDPTPAQASFTVDTQSPSVSISPPTSPTSDNTPTITFTASDPAPGTALTTRCSVDGGALAVCTSPFTTAVLSNGSHTITVQTTDAAGNSASAAVTIMVDTIAPSVSISSPVNGSVSNNNSPAVAYTVSDANPGTTDCKLDAGAFGACAPSLSGLSDASHTFSVRHTDLAGNATTASVTFTIDTTNPVVSVTAPSGVTGDNTPAIAFSVADATSTTSACSVDGGAFSSCVSGSSLAALADGSHTLAVQSTDAAGNTGTGSTSFTVDATAPTVVITSPANGSTTSNTTPPLTYTVTEANPGTTQCSIDGGAFAACPSPNLPTLTTGSHTVVVRHTDAAGNIGSATTTFNVVAGLTVTISSPVNGSYVNTASPALTYSASGGTSPYTYQCSLDGAAFGACPASLSGLTNASHTIAVRVTDSSSPTAQTSTTTNTFTVDTIAPVVSVTSPANGSYVNTASPTLTFSATDANAGTTTCSVDGAAFGSCPATLSGLTNAAHTVAVRHTDLAGNVTTVTNSFTVDTVLPVVTISSPPSGFVTTTTPTLTFAVTETNPGTNACSIDSGAFTACTSGTTMTALSQGAHTLVVRHTDLAGNIGTSATRSFTVDSIAPTVSIASPANGSTTTDTTPPLTYTVTEANPGTTQCSIDAAAFAACPSPDLPTLTTGSHTVIVRHTDAAGNIGSSTTTFNVVAGLSVSISSPANGAYIATASPTLTYSASGGATPYTFQCSLDGAAFGACPASLSGLTNASHTIAVRATDSSSPTPQVATATNSFTVDTIAPTVTVTSPANGSFINTASPTLTFSVTDANPGTTQCSVDGAVFGSCPASLSGLTNASHTVAVRHTDLAGNVTTTTNTFTVDTVAPTVTISSPAAGSISTTTSATYSVTDTNLSANSECQVDGGAFTSCANSGSVGPLADGAHTVVVRHTDKAGNVNSASRSFTVDTTAPTVVISSPANGSSTGNTTPPLTYTVTDANPGTTQCQIDGGAFAACPSPNLPTLTIGSHTVVVRHTDAAGNIGSATTTFNVVNVLTVTISAPISGTYVNTTTPALSFSASNGTAPYTYQCSVDGGAFAACTSGAALSALSQGSHTVQVRATDSSTPTAQTATASTTFTVDSVNPVVSVTAPNGFVNTTTPTRTFTVTETNQGTSACSVDGGAFTTCTSGTAMSALTQGAHTLVVRHTDLAGNIGTSATANFTVDSIAPTVSITSPANGSFVNTASPAVTFSLVEANPGTSQCKVDAGAFGACPANLSGLSNAVHTLTIQHTDLAGNVGSSTSTFTVDTIAPVVTVTSPANGSFVNTVSPTLTFTATDTNAGTTQCSVDGAVFGSCPASLSALTNASHTVAVRHTDLAGNVTTVTNTFTVDTVAPVVSVSAPTGFVTTTTPTQTFSVTETNLGSSTCSVDAGAFTACTSGTTMAALSQGAHTLVVRHTDLAGNVGTSATASFTVDSVLPVVTISSPASGFVTTTTPTLTFAVTETNPGTSACSIDSGPFTACTSGTTMAALSQGAHTLVVRHTDLAGNIGTSATRSFTVDSIAPVVTISSPANGSYVNTASPTLTFAVTETNPGATTCSLDGAVFGACPATLTGLSNAVHTIAVRHVDAAGNATTTTNSFTVDTVAPVVTVTSPANGSFVNTASPTLTFSATDANAGTTQCSVDGGVFGACPASLSALTNASHTVAVRHTDLAGNVTTVTNTFTVDTVNPVVSVSAPTGFVNTTTPTRTFSVTETNAGSSTCSVDGGAFTACTSGTAMAALTQGAHTLVVRHTDLAGNIGTSATASFTVDSIAPVVSVSSPANGSYVNTASPTLTFAVTETNLGTTTCSLDGAAFGSCPATLTGLSNAVHTIAVRHVDLAGNSTTTTNSFTVDSIAPVVTISSPANGSYVNTASPTLTFAVTEANPGATTCSLDGAVFGACPATLTGLSNAVHTIAVRHVDAAGNATTTTNSFTVDTIAPVVTVTSPANGSFVNTASPTLTFTATDTNAGTTQCSVDGAVFGSCPASLSALTNASHTVAVRHTDLAGNVTTVTNTFTVDTVLPTVSISSPPSGFVTTTTPTLTFAVTETNPGTNACSIDSGAFTACTSGTTMAALSQGAHTLVVRHTDLAGNIGTSATRSFTVDSVLPVVAITAPAAGFVTTTTPTLSFTVTETNLGTTQCQVDAGAFAACTSGNPVAALSQGAHTLTVRHTDAAGNVGTASRSITVDSISPVVAITAPAAGYVTTATPALSFTVTEANPGTTQCQVDAGAFAACTSGSATASLSDGAHTLTVRHTDAAGNVGTASVAITVDTINPVVAISSPANGSTVTTATPPLTFTVTEAHPGTTQCQIDGGAFAACPAPNLPTLADGSHTVVVRHTDAAGRIGSATTTFTVSTVVAPDTQITTGPEGGLSITDPTPSWDFTSTDPSATFECSVDGAAFTACTSPYSVPDNRGTGGANGFDTGDGGGGPPNGRIDTDEALSHTFAVRAKVGSTVDASPDSAAFNEAEFLPSFTVGLSNPADPTDVDGNNAVAHPDVTLNAVNPAGDPESVVAYAPDYAWGSNYAVPVCSTTDADAGLCIAASQIGTVSITADVNRVPHDSIAGMHSLTVTGNVYLTQSWAPGEAAGAVAKLHIVDTDGRDYGTINQRLHLLVDTVGTDDPSTPTIRENTSIYNPRGLKAVVDGVPRVSPGTVDGAQLELHGRSLIGTIWGNRPDYQVPLIYNSADCSSTPDPDTGRPVEWRGVVNTYAHTGNTDRDSAELTQPYSVDNCATVPFAPLIEKLDLTSTIDGTSAADPLNPPPSRSDTDYDGIPDAQTPLTADATISVPPESSTLRSAVLNLPPGLRQRTAGLSGTCTTADAQQNADRDFDLDGIIDITDYVNCNMDTSMVGTAEIVSPLIETPQQGEIFIEDTGGAIPAMYAIVRNESLGLNARVRTYPETISVAGGLSYIRATINATASNAPADLPSIPITKLTLSLLGSPANGPIVEIASQCNDQESGWGNAKSWSDPNPDPNSKTSTIMGPRIYLGNASSPCVPVSQILTDNPADADPGLSPAAGDVTRDTTPTWTGARDYANSTGTTRYLWFECSTDNVVWAYCGDQTRGTDEVQRLTKTGTVSGGTFTLTFNGQTTSALNFNASTATIKAALEALSTLGSDTVNVVFSSGTTFGAAPQTTFTFVNAHGAENVPQMTITSSLTGGGTEAATTVTSGVAGTFPRYYQVVQNGVTVTHTRIVQPLNSQVPLSTGDGHKFSIRLKAHLAAPPCTASCTTGSSGTGTVQNYPGLSFGTAEIPFKVDTDVPVGTAIVGGPADGATTSDSPVYLFSSTDVTANFQCNVDGGGWVTCPSGQPLVGYPHTSGLHSFQVRAWDGVNADPTPVTRTFVVP